MKMIQAIIVLIIGVSIGSIGSYRYLKSYSLHRFIDQQVELKLEVFKYELIKNYDMAKWEHADQLFVNGKTLEWSDLDDKTNDDNSDLLVDHTTTPNGEKTSRRTKRNDTSKKI